MRPNGFDARMFNGTAGDGAGTKFRKFAIIFTVMPPPFPLPLPLPGLVGLVVVVGVGVGVGVGVTETAEHEEVNDQAMLVGSDVDVRRVQVRS